MSDEVPEVTLVGRTAAPEPIRIPADTKFGYVEDAIYWGSKIHEDIHAKDTPRGYPDVYLGCPADCGPHERPEGYTITIDPLKPGIQAWILPGTEERHTLGLHRGALKDHAGVVRAARIAGQPDPNAAPPRNYLPTSRDLDNSLKFTPHCNANSTRGWFGKLKDMGDRTFGIKYETGEAGQMQMKNDGRLPVISQAIWQNKLIDKPDWLVDRELHLRQTHLNRDRRFDCTGWCR